MKIWKQFRKTFDGYQPDANSASWDTLEQKLSHAEQFVQNPYQTPKAKLFNFQHLSNFAKFSVVSGAAASLVVGIALFTTPLIKSGSKSAENKSVRTEIEQTDAKSSANLTQNKITNTENIPDSLDEQNIQSPDIHYNQFVERQQNNTLAQKASSVPNNIKSQTQNNTYPVQRNTNTPAPFMPVPAYQPQQPMYVYNSASQNGAVNQIPKATVNPANQPVNQQVVEKQNMQSKDNRINPNQTDSENQRPNNTDNDTKSETEQRPELVIPNVITPNGDGINDEFEIKNLEKYEVKNIVITDRNGKVVFDVINYQNNWSANNLPEGVYYYMLKIRYDNENFVKSGMITVIRR